MNLERFGFTSTESKVYVALLRLSPATGYAVAREAGLARANAYGALETLATRGVVARLPGRPARFVAEDPATLVGRLGRDSQRDLELLARSLAGVERRTDIGPTASLTPLPDRAAVMARCAACARDAREEVLAVTGPWASDLSADLAVRGQSRPVFRVLSLGSPAPTGALVRPVPTSEIKAYWGGLPIALVADRRRAVCAVLTDSAATGVATEHPALVPFIRHLLRREVASALSPHQGDAPGAKGSNRAD